MITRKQKIHLLWAFALLLTVAVAIGRAQTLVSDRLATTDFIAAAPASYRANILEGVNQLPAAVTFAGGVAKGNWLVVSRSNSHDYERRNFDPCYTTVRSDYRPVVRKVGQQWEITFVTETASQRAVDLP